MSARRTELRTIWITGAGGLIGNYLVQTAPGYVAQAAVVALTRSDLDLTDAGAVKRAFRAQKPTLVLHCAALSQSPDCEANPELARRLNVEATAQLAGLAADIPFVFYSTDLVFDGRTGNYDEAAPINPLSVYARTKAAAEGIVLANPRHTVIRTSLNGGISPSGDRGFNEKLRIAWGTGKALDLFTDEFRSPIPAEITARATWELVLKGRPGLYHVAGAERLSRFQMGQLIAARWPELKPRIVPGSLRDYTGAPRPPDTSLNCGKVEKLLSFRLPGLSRWLAENPEAPF